MKLKFAFLLIPIYFSACGPFYSTPITKQEILQDIRLKDNSYVGLLLFCNFEGSVENRNSFTINRVDLVGTLYNCETKTRSTHRFSITTPISSYSCSTYKEKIFVGRHINVEKVAIVDAQW